MKLGMEAGLGHGHIVLDEDPVPPPKRGGMVATSPTFLPMYCGQAAGWIKMPLGMEVGLSPGHMPYCVRWGLSSPS